MRNEWLSLVFTHLSACLAAANYRNVSTEMKDGCLRVVAFYFLPNVAASPRFRRAETSPEKRIVHVTHIYADVCFFTYSVDIRMYLKEGKSAYTVFRTMCLSAYNVNVYQSYVFTHAHTRYTYTSVHQRTHIHIYIYMYTIDWSTRKFFRPLVYFRTTAFIGRKSGRYFVINDRTDWELQEAIYCDAYTPLKCYILICIQRRIQKDVHR